MFKKITIIANPIAGGIKYKEKIINFILDYFSKNDRKITIRQTSKRGEATELAKQAVKEKVDLVVVIGGDGTINEVGTGLVNTKVTLGIIPSGSGNGLARSLKIPGKVDQACQLISKGHICSIDVGKANNRYFFLVLGVGFDALVGKRFAESHRRGPIPYFYFGLKEFFVYKSDWLKISFDCKMMEIKPFVIAIANGQQYGNGAIIAPDAKLNDGILDICIVHRLTFFQTFSAIPKLFKGQIYSYPDAEFHRTQSIRIERESPALVNIDGEPIFEDSVVDISILPKSLRVIASPNSPCLS